MLAKVMSRYEQGLRASGVELKRDQWYGPGAAAQTWMRNQNVVDREMVELAVPETVLDFARQSYYGGWFEVFVHGHVPGVSYEFDVNSAYPYAMSLMPEWSECEYEWIDMPPAPPISAQEYLAGHSWTTGLALVDASTTGADQIVGSMLHRRKDGTILRPHTTRGVRWAAEVAAAVAAGLIDTIAIHRVLVIRPTLGSVLNTAIPEIYKRRLEVGKNTVHGKAFKLIYNSAYGKQAQSIGSPKFSNALSASYITSHCRTMILNAIATHPDGTSALLMVATDGVYFRSPHPGLEIDKGALGKWDASEKHNLTIVMPGVYYDDKAREAVLSGNYAGIKSRGISAGSLAAAIGNLDLEFSKLAHDPSDPRRWPTMNVPVRFSVTSPRLALHQGKWQRAGTVERDVDRVLDTNPRSKRVAPGAQGTLALFEDMEPYLDDSGLVRSRPYDICGDGQSFPYAKQFGLEIDAKNLGQSPDGPVAQELFSLIGD